MSVTLPVDANAGPHYSFGVELDGVSYGLEFRWNARAESWFMAIYDGEDTLLLPSVRVVLGVLLARRFRAAGVPGDFVAVDTTGRQEDAGLRDFGTRVLLLYYSAGELRMSPVTVALGKVTFDTVSATAPSIGAVMRQRRCEVHVTSQTGVRVVLTGLRIQFHVEKSLGKEPNKVEVSITNLARQSRAALQTKGLLVALHAGYEGALSQVARGDLRSCDQVREGADWRTKLTCGDGERAYVFAPVSLSFRKGTPVTEALRGCVDALVAAGLDAGNAYEKCFEVEGQFVSGYSAHGRASAEASRNSSGRAGTTSLSKTGALRYSPKAKRSPPSSSSSPPTRASSAVRSTAPPRRKAASPSSR